MKTPAGQRTQTLTELQIYLRDINGTSLLTSQDERDLAAKVAAGDPHARDTLVRANLRLVVSIARGFVGKGVSLEDLIEEGNLGLLRAVEGFDGSRDIRFSTYAGYWIKQSMRRGVINHGKPIRLPAHMVKLITKFRRAEQVLSDRLGRTPAAEEVGAALGFSKKKLALVREGIHAYNLTPYADGEEGSACDALTDGRSRAPDEILMESDELKDVRDRLGRLDAREAEVLRLRFGIEDRPELSLRAVGESLGLTRERIRQVEKDAMKKLLASHSDS